jgi:hypothetical protein
MSDTSHPTAEAAAADHLYEIRTEGDTAYRAEGELVLENGWFKLRRTDGALTLQVPQHRVLAARLLDPAELETEAASIDRDHLAQQIDEARQWARHGYEIGQKHCSWSDHGVAPDWLTEGWPLSFDSCEHLLKAAEFDEALARVRGLSVEPEVMNAQQEHPGVWKHGYECGVLAAKSAARPCSDGTRES